MARPPTLVSVIMPVWQPRRPWLLAAVRGALDQAGCDIELIVVDDGNPEPVAGLLADLDDARLRILRTPHAGPNAARNSGMAAARGGWIRFIDADDVPVGGSTGHLASFMDGDSVIACGGTAVVDEELRPRYVIASDLRGDVAAACLLGQFHMRLGALLFPRRVVERAGPWEPAFRVSGDWDFVLRAVEHARVAGDRRIASYYRRHPGSLSRSADIGMGDAARGHIIERYFDRHPEQRGSALERRARAAQCLDRGMAYWRAGQYPQALTRLPRALLADPRGAGPVLARFMLRETRRRARSRSTRPLPE